MGESRFLGKKGKIALPPRKCSSGMTYWKEKRTPPLTLEIGSITGYVQGQGEYMAELTALCKTSPLTSPPQSLPLKPGNGLVETKRKSKSWSERATAKFALRRSFSHKHDVLFSCLVTIVIMFELHSICDLSGPERQSLLSAFHECEH